MPTEQKTSIDITGNSNCDLAQVICTEGNTQKYNRMENKKSVCAGKSAIEICFNKIFNKNFF